jgi:(2S)-methylsuccinyl-CoA dehydrogenase
LRAAYGEYLAQIAGGIPLSQTEVVRPTDMGACDLADAHLGSAAIRLLVTRGNTDAVRMQLAAQIGQAGCFGNAGVTDESLITMREHIRRFGESRIAPHAHHWHRHNELIPLDVVAELAGLGVFGLTIPEQHGGLGLGKVAMCLVTEELSRVFLGVGSLGTRSEIAAELIGSGGTAEQQARWLPRIASGAALPTAVFTEPSAGSDLAALRTRAVRDTDAYRISGAKTWITHAARADMMTLLARTGAPESGYKGLSMFLASKPRGTDADPFPIAGLSGSEIPVLGYRGMKEYELTLSDFRVPAADLLGGVEGQGFKQLMATFEAARIQTAARATGVAQNALELGLAYASGRRQFAQRLIDFPRVGGKLAWMAVETMVARQLTYYAARAKDSGQRCDVEAGMAKLLAARVAWANADCALQIHGGNGYAEEYAISRVLCDARILSIFEGAAEIQADVIARRLLWPQD